MNALLLFSIEPNGSIAYLLVISLIINIAIHRVWSRMKKPLHMFNNHSLNGSGVVHLFFSTIQMVIVAIVLISAGISILHIISLSITLVFGLLIFYGSYQMNSRIDPLDFFAGALVVIVSSLRIIGA